MKNKKKSVTLTFQHNPNVKQSEYEKGFRMDELFPVQIGSFKSYDPHLPSIVFVRQENANGFSCTLVSAASVNYNAPETVENWIIFPLYCSPETNTRQSSGQVMPSSLLEDRPQKFGNSEKARIPNLNFEIVKQIADRLGLSFIPEKEPEGKVCYINNPEVRDDFKTTFAPIDVLNYIYASLHSPTYNEKYKELLKTNFPRIPYPKAGTFWQLVKLGGELRQVHSSEVQTAEKLITILKEIDKIGIE